MPKTAFVLINYAKTVLFDSFELFSLTADLIHTVVDDVYCHIKQSNRSVLHLIFLIFQNKYNDIPFFNSSE